MWAGSDDSSAQRRTLLYAVADRDQGVVNRYKDAAAQVTGDQADTATKLTETQAELDLARVDEAQAQADLNSAQLEVAVTTVGGNIVIHGFSFPVASPHTFRQDFGDPRLPGTAQAHAHEGCDVAAAEGTSLFAAERGDHHPAQFGWPGWDRAVDQGRERDVLLLRALVGVRARPRGGSAGGSGAARRLRRAHWRRIRPAPPLRGASERRRRGRPVPDPPGRTDPQQAPRRRSTLMGWTSLPS